MTTKEFIEDYAKDQEITKKEAEAHVTGVIEAIRNAILKGETVDIYKFGTFGSKTNPERLAHNPRTKEKVTVPEKRVPTFKFSGTFKKSVEE